MVIMKNDTYIFISRSGGGKGTQIALLEKHFEDNDLGETLHLEAGDRFRDFISYDTYSGKLARARNDAGLLQPSFLAVWAWGGEIIRKLKPEHNLFIDGTPRQMDEALILEEALEFYDRKKVTVVHVKVSREWAIQRMTERKRDDDKTVGAMKKRLDWFDSDVLPVLNYFSKNEKYRLVEVDGEREMGDVHKEILEKLNV